MTNRHTILPLAAAVAALTACSMNELEMPQGDGSIAFGATMEAPAQTRAGATGEMTIDALKVYDATSGGGGFGVYAYYTGSQTWAQKGATTTPNFMFNQQVYWDSYNTGNWLYSPTKYWPNDNATADNQQATGSQDANYVSFFAYAPYVDADADLGTTGITALCANTATGNPTVTYVLDPDPEKQVDLIWGTRGQASYNEADGTPNTAATPTNTDLTKQTTNERVNFAFKHALASVDVYVRRVYDELQPTGKAPADASKIFVSQLQLAISDMPSSAVFDLATGTWSNSNGSAIASKTITIGINDIDHQLQGTLEPNTNLTAVQNVELNPFDTKSGVDQQLRRLTERPYLTMLVPSADNTGIAITPTISYSFVTQDPQLALNMPNSTASARYARITHTVSGQTTSIGTATAPATYKLLPGYRYMLVCSIGAESVQFQVVGIEDWDFPLRFTPTTSDFTSETADWQGRIVNE